MDSELVTGPDGEPVDILIPAIQPPDVDPRIIGTYNGDGSMVNADMLEDRFPIFLGVILWGIITGVVCFLAILVPQSILNGGNMPSQLRSIAIFSTLVGFVVAGTIFCENWHFIMAHLRFSIHDQEAEYWHRNRQLRQNCRMPHTTREFRALLRLAQELDREKAPEYVAQQTANYFARLVDDRGLWSQNASSAWLGPVVLQGIMDAQHPEGDPDDEQSGASEE